MTDSINNSDDQLRDRSADDRIERLLLGLTPRSTPPSVRQRVLAELEKVSQEGISPVRAGWLTTSDFSVAALVLVTALAWVTSVNLHSNRMRELLGPTSAERRAQRDARTLDSLASEEAISGMQAQLTTLYEQAQRSRGVLQTVHSPSLELLPDFWRDKNAKADHQDSYRPDGNSSTRRSSVDLEIQRAT